MRIVLAVLLLLLTVASSSAATLPSSVADLELWLQADDGPQTGGLPSLPTQTVDTWLDSSALNNDGTGAATPTLQLRNYNSLTFPVVEFSGGDRFTTSTNLVGASTYLVVFSQQNNSNANGRFLSAQGAGNRNFTVFGNQLNTYDGTNGYVFSSNLQNADFHIAVLRAQTNNPEMFLDGTAEAFSTANAGGPYPTYNLATITSLLVGADPGGGQGLIGDIAEVVVYNRALTDQELNDVGFYLQDKYGIDGAYLAPPLAAAIPEPSTWMLLGLGLAALAARRHRRAA